METKQWWKSKSVWGSIVMLLAIALGYFGIELGAEEQVALVDQIVAAIVAISALVGAVLSLIGRLKATTKLTR